MALGPHKAAKAKARKEYKREWKRPKKGLGPQGSSTPGSVKVERCHASGLDKYFAKHNRSWKHPGYDAWVAAHATERR